MSEYKSQPGNIRSILRSESGQGILEVLAALAVAMVVLTALTVASVNSVRNAAFSKNQTIANAYATQGMESVRTYRDINAAAFFNLGKTPGCYMIDETTDATGFTTNTVADNWLLLNGNDTTCNSMNNVGTYEDLGNGFIRKISIDNSANSACYSQSGVSSANGQCGTVIVSVFWQDSAGSHKASLTSYFSDFESGQ